ncbi:MAG: SHOCT domain-containing protein [Candidatus Puniceispirillales bacterium]
MSFDNKFDGEASRTIYIVAWIIASLVNAIITETISLILFDILVQQEDDYTTYLFILTVVNTIVSAGVFVTIYSYFIKIIIRKVIIWLWGLGLLGTIINSASAWQSFYFIDKNNPVLDVIIPFNVIGFIVLVLLFIQYFKWNSRLVDVNIVGWPNNNNKEPNANKENKTNREKTPPSIKEKTLKEELSDLKNLYDEGLITKEAWNKKQEEILGVKKE